MCAFQAGIIFFEICSCSELNDDMGLGRTLFRN